ncbi:hypothetical protein LINGRAHAP2_LOCUS28962 [Linum grandiflorum]
MEDCEISALLDCTTMVRILIPPN